MGTTLAVFSRLGNTPCRREALIIGQSTSECAAYMFNYLCFVVGGRRVSKFFYNAIDLISQREYRAL